MTQNFTPFLIENFSFPCHFFYQVKVFFSSLKSSLRVFSLFPLLFATPIERVTGPLALHEN